MSDLEYDRAQTQESQRVVSQEATAETSQAAGGLNTMATSQSETRWGVEEGAVAYKAQYEKNLQAVHGEVPAPTSPVPCIAHTNGAKITRATTAKRAP